MKKDPFLAFINCFLKFVKTRLKTDPFSYGLVIDKAFKSINSTELYSSSQSSLANLNQELLNDSYKKNSEIEVLFENQQKNQEKLIEESKLQITLASKYRKLYKLEKAKTLKLTSELQLAFQRINELQDQVTRHAKLHDEFVRELDHMEIKDKYSSRHEY